MRLKGGDPFLFGRGGEELELLAENNVPFEIVPGVTSAFAVPAYNGIPVTHRDFCSSVHIITGHRRGDSAESDPIDFKALAATGGTLIFLMGISELSRICKGLLSAGMDPATPAAVLERGTTARQRRTVSGLGELERACERAGVMTPAIIIVGKVCSLAESFAWFEKKPLFGVRALVTRPKELSGTLAGMLREKGAEVIELPAIEIAPIRPNPGLDAAIARLDGALCQGVDSGTASEGAASEMAASETEAFETATSEGAASEKAASEKAASEVAYDWIVFTSPSGVRVFMEALLGVSDIRALSRSKIAAIGKGSEAALLKYGIKADFVPSVYDGETLGRELAGKLGANAKVLIPRAEIGNPELVEELRKSGCAEVEDLPTYRTVYVKSRFFKIGDYFRDGEIDFAVFTSASAVKGFASAIDGELEEKVDDGAAAENEREGFDFSCVRAVCIGKQTAAAASALGMRTLTAKEATLQALVGAAERAAKDMSGDSIDSEEV